MNFSADGPKKGKALVTGADGFTGRYMTFGLLRSGYEVHGLIRGPSVGTCELASGAAHMHVCDLLDSEAMRRLVQDVCPDYVVHLAGVSFVAGIDVEDIYKTNLLGTRVLLESLAALGQPPRATLLASSANVYGNATEGVMYEWTPPAPANDYAVSKLAMEYMARLYTARLPLVVCRPFNYTGVGQAASFLLPKVVAHAKSQKKFIELGNLEVARDFSDVRMVVTAYSRLLVSTAAIGHTFNVCSGTAYTLEEVLALVEELSGHQFSVQVNPALQRHNEVKRLLGSRAQLDTVIGAIRDYSLRETLSWMLSSVPEDQPWRSPNEDI